MGKLLANIEFIAAVQKNNLEKFHFIYGLYKLLKYINAQFPT